MIGINETSVSLENGITKKSRKFSISCTETERIKYMAMCCRKKTAIFLISTNSVVRVAESGKPSSTQTNSFVFGGAIPFQSVGRFFFFAGSQTI